MQTGLQLLGGPDGTIHTIWTGNIGGEGPDGDAVVLGNVDYGNAGEVQMARDAIPRMAAWSDFREWAFQADREDEGLAAIAEIILCTRAAIWQRGKDRLPAPGLTSKDADAAQVKLFSVLSPRGLQAMTAGPEVAKDGIRYSPVTGDAEADQLLPMVVRPDVASALRARSIGRCEAADLLEGHAAAWHEDKPIREQADFLDDESWSLACERQSDKAATFSERAATLWSSTDKTGAASAQSWDMAAISWTICRQHDRAAQDHLKAAALWEAAGRPGDQANAYGEAARSLWYAGKYDLAEETRAKGARAWEAAKRFDLQIETGSST